MDPLDSTEDELKRVLRMMEEHPFLSDAQFEHLSQKADVLSARIEELKRQALERQRERRAQESQREAERFEARWREMLEELRLQQIFEQQQAEQKERAELRWRSNLSVLRAEAERLSREEEAQRPHGFCARCGQSHAFPMCED